ncbi:hypothetical protein DFH11DRAFT_542496 [Phellopilus nigrolimitatus]|nr:hypothetical protein DFH11DRAFT_542496 [Phellopilus nigrolimitatus]
MQVRRSIRKRSLTPRVLGRNAGSVGCAAHGMVKLKMLEAFVRSYQLPSHFSHLQVPRPRIPCAVASADLQEAGSVLCSKIRVIGRRDFCCFQVPKAGVAPTLSFGDTQSLVLIHRAVSARTVQHSHAGNSITVFKSSSLSKNTHMEINTKHLQLFVDCFSALRAFFLTSRTTDYAAKPVQDSLILPSAVLPSISLPVSSIVYILPTGINHQLPAPANFVNPQSARFVRCLCHAEIKKGTQRENT